ncbi:uncharacterized protein EI90DRAFT_3050785 [Cantharellus anzutake]|uniref:uncharacterized protein n=1 Tax=Cantharellus anzutake TaxID=1750568 RepID=UPI001907E037|nr:uncharacterized protein EI90DRAFT_3050785 [Cantharellus anzutake]KAF8334040.1 hypothetical protein EI90DRAFT_3050785 [Cantharellus anzutake]
MPMSLHVEYRHGTPTGMGMNDGSRRVISAGHAPCVNNAETTFYGRPPTPPLSAIPEFSKASGVKTTPRLRPPTPSRSSLGTSCAIEIKAPQLDRQEIPSLIITPPDEDGFSGKILGEDSSCVRTKTCGFLRVGATLDVDMTKSEDEPPRGRSRLKKVLHKPAPSVTQPLRSIHDTSPNDFTGLSNLKTPPAEEINGPFGDILAAIKDSIEESEKRHDQDERIEFRGVIGEPDVSGMFLSLFQTTNESENRTACETSLAPAEADHGPLALGSKTGEVAPQNGDVEVTVGSRPRSTLLGHAPGKKSLSRKLSRIVTKTPSIVNFWGHRHAGRSSSSPFLSRKGPSDQAQPRSMSSSFNLSRSPRIAFKSDQIEVRVLSAGPQNCSPMFNSPEVVSCSTTAEGSPSLFAQCSAETVDESSSNGAPQISLLSPQRFKPKYEARYPGTREELLAPLTSRAATALSRRTTCPNQNHILPPLSFDSFVAHDVLHYVLASVFIRHYSMSKWRRMGGPNKFSVRSLRRRSNRTARSSNARRMSSRKASPGDTDKPLPPVPSLKVSTTSSDELDGVPPSPLYISSNIDVSTSGGTNTKGANGNEALKEPFVVNFGPNPVLDLEIREAHDEAGTTVADWLL